MALYSQDWLTQPIPVGGVVNANFDAPSDMEEHALNTVIHARDGTQWRYARAHANIAAEGQVAVGTNGVTATGTTHEARTAVAINQYAWLQVL